MLSLLAPVRQASRTLIQLNEETVNEVLKDLASTLIERGEEILKANAKDLARMEKDDPTYDRLLLNKERLEAIATDMRNVAVLPSPLNIILEERDLPSGLHLKRVSVPLGVIGIIYEARPNVTFDVFALCFKSGNACVLKGGSDAADSNRAIVNIIHDVLRQHNVDANVCHLLPPEREAVTTLLDAVDDVDIIIPRGSERLINFVREHAKVPVIETGAGICHTYVDASADISKAAAIVTNAKTRRVSVCNALDCLIIHKGKLGDLPAVVERLKEHNVEIFADALSFKALQGSYPEALLRKATPAHFGTEFLSLKMSVKTVANLDEALKHIAQFSSKHSEAIVAEDTDTIERFLKEVDAASVYSNASTAFTDGAQFGLGAEIGISTQKLHARGPMALRELTSYKWVLRGHGETRP